MCENIVMDQTGMAGRFTKRLARDKSEMMDAKGE
jgi:hypothetical protein